METFCPLLSNNVCRPLNVECFRLRVREACDFKIYYKLLTETSKDPKVAGKVKKNILPEVLEEWNVMSRPQDLERKT
jgi:hypothetical protein